MSTTPPRSDSLPAKRDETAEQLRRLADLVQADRWEEADRLMYRTADGFDDLLYEVRSIRRKRREDEHGYEPPRTEQLEACRYTVKGGPLDGIEVGSTVNHQRDPDDAPKRPMRKMVAKFGV